MLLASVLVKVNYSLSNTQKIKSSLTTSPVKVRTSYPNMSSPFKSRKSGDALTSSNSFLKELSKLLDLIS